MKLRKYTQGITIFMTPEMYREVKGASDKMEISLSEFFRRMVSNHFEKQQSEGSGTRHNPNGKEVISYDRTIESTFSEMLSGQSNNIKKS